MSIDALAMREPLEQFRDAIRAAGLQPPNAIEPDGALHRFPTNGRKSDDSGWYLVHVDGIPAGAFGCWRAGVSETWRADVGRALSVQEEAEHRKRVKAMQREREADNVKRKAEARGKAAAIWEAAKPAPPDHAYLSSKRIGAHGLRVHDGKLVVPMRQGRTLHSLQLISGGGDKRFLPGGRVVGCYFPIGKPGDVLCIAEGFATGASIHECAGHAVAVAFNAGNLLAVAKALRAQFPEGRLIVCADDDSATPANPGLAKAREAAQAVDGLLAIPDFGAERPSGATDFNDLHRSAGAEAVRACIERAQAAGEFERVRTDSPLDSWPEPLNLLRRASAVPLDADDTVPVIADYALAFARAGGFCASATILPAVAVCAAAMDDSIRLRLPVASSWFESARLWVVAIGPPASGKTPTARAMLAPLIALHREVLEAWQSSKPRQDDGLEEDGRRPPSPALLSNDATVEALSDILQANPRGLLYQCDEFESWLGSLDCYRSSGNGSKDRGEWLRLYDGGPHQIDRIRRGSIFVSNWGASLLSATTPGALKKLAAKLPVDGLLQRFMPVLVDAMRAPDPLISPTEVDRARQRYDAAVRRLYGLQGSVVVKLGREARELFEHEHERLRAATEAVEALSEAFSAHLAKHAAMLARVALTYHCLTAGDHREDMQAGPMQAALSFMHKIRRHAFALYFDLVQESAAPGVSVAHDVARFLIARLPEQIRRRDVTQKVRAFRSASSHAQDAAMQYLHDCSWIEPLPSTYDKGRPTVWLVNPKLGERFSAEGAAERKRRAEVRILILEKAGDRRASNC